MNCKYSNTGVLITRCIAS